MYLIITEIQREYKTKNVSEADLLASDDGYCQIFDITNPENPLTYFDGKWEEIEEWDQ